MESDGAVEKIGPLLVTTAHRGVFFGYGTLSGDSTMTLEMARICIYWPNETHGVLGLASHGPGKGSRVGPAVPQIILRDVTACAVVTEQAALVWESEPWS